MTRPRIPGTVLLKIAPVLFSERFVSAVVRPTIADLQSEALAAGSDRVKRLRALGRGYCAFWACVLVAPFASWAAPTPPVDGLAVSRAVIGALIIASVAVPVLGAWVALLAATGALVAILIHAWYERHPSRLPGPSDTPSPSPQINFSSTQVGGNVGGLIFVVGSLLIVSVGLPSVFWFLLAGSVAACFLAWGLVAWHTRHPRRGLPESRITLR
jgi:hypothetical protein